MEYLVANNFNALANALAQHRFNEKSFFHPFYIHIAYMPYI